MRHPNAPSSSFCSWSTGNARVLTVSTHLNLQVHEAPLDEGGSERVKGCGAESKETHRPARCFLMRSSTLSELPTYHLFFSSLSTYTPLFAPSCRLDVLFLFVAAGAAVSGGCAV